MSKSRPYGFFPARRKCRRRIDPVEPEPVPDGEYQRYYGACVSVPDTADGVKALSGTDYKATVGLTVADSQTDRDAPYYAYACPTAYGLVSGMMIEGLPNDFDSRYIEIDSEPYWLVWTPYAQYSSIAIALT